jgi:hypothetical protein
MNTTAFTKKMSVFKTVRGKLILLAVALGAGGLVWLGGCMNVGLEGDYCNPYLMANSTSDCNAGLACTVQSYGPPTTAPYASVGAAAWSPNAPCAENYCCPIAGGSTNPVCQPGCGGGAAYICSLGMALPPGSSLAYVCAAAAAIEAGTPIPDGATEPDSEADAGSDAAPDAAPDSAPDAAPDSASDAELDAAPDSGAADAADGG